MKEEITDCTLNLFKLSNEKDQNTIFSPLSALYSLAMAANGSDGNTKKQFEAMFGLSVEELNDELKKMMTVSANNDEEWLYLANAACFDADGGIRIRPEFVQLIGDLFDAEVFKINPVTGVKDFNRWVSDKTSGIINDIMDDTDAPVGNSICLFNATAFKNEWMYKYEDDDVRNDVFTLDDGTRKEVRMMFSEEHGYFEDTDAIGFAKPYSGGEYEFLAILPKGDISLNEFIGTITCSRLESIVKHNDWISDKVDAAIPKFEADAKLDLKEAVKCMGVTDAFDDSANLRRMAMPDVGDFKISDIYQKAWISVDETGTRAYAATFMGATTSALEHKKKIHLNRPFLYLIVDKTEDFPVFMGTVTDLPGKIIESSVRYESDTDEFEDIFESHYFKY